MLSVGKVAQLPEIGETRSLTREEVVNTPRARHAHVVKRLRDSHHMVARMVAAGLRPKEVATESGYALTTICNLNGDPAFQELVAQYRLEVNDEFKANMGDYFSVMAASRNKAARLIADKLDTIDSPDDVSFRELALIHDSAADRTGYGKRQTNVNINVDFAARLDRAVKRSGLVKAAHEPEVIDANFRVDSQQSAQEVLPPGRKDRERDSASAPGPLRRL